MSSIDNFILIVEDDEDVAETIGLILETDGFRCAVARDGAEALDMLRADPLPRAVLLDMMMPGMSGSQFRAAQLQDPRIAGIPIILMTGDHRAEGSATALGVAKFLRKPIGMHELLDTLKQMI